MRERLDAVDNNNNVDEDRIEYSHVLRLCTNDDDDDAYEISNCICSYLCSHAAPNTPSDRVSERTNEWMSLCEHEHCVPTDKSFCI